jgi:fatty-acid desaturase
MSTHHRMQPADPQTNPVEGTVYWKWSKSLWWTAVTLVALGLAPWTFSWSAAGVALGLTLTTLCLGHTLGMHRLLIHRSYDCPRWLEHTFVYLGVLVGIAGPFRIVYMHDIRDWSQRHPRCHAFFIHTHGWWRDFIEQQHCDVALAHPPRFVLEERISGDGFYRWLQRTWLLQQIPLALALYALGGISWVAWGSGVRLFFSINGHWLVGYLAHNHGGRTWHIEHAAVQGYNVRGFSLLTMGENWHNNHHAYPESARLGLRAGEWDLGWLVLRVLRKLGLVWNLQTPETLPARKERVAIEPR